MSYRYGKTSKARLATCHPEIQRLFNSLINDYDVSIICGHRTEAEQNAAVAKGASKTKYPNSKHNSLPSLGIDAALYPIDWEDVGRHYMFVGIVRERARQLGIPIRCGADWDSDFATNDQTFNDLVHFEYAGA
ncbi:hedgehog signaling/DD-peptidase zinc-binding domain protein [Vibrio phage 1.089.O._10N.261.51.F9]|nr:hedgehog signaling/DD-peptidase zinc-binding domain protein [Vibrio phage 1.012.O._10N.261.48.C12]AUR86795.1 hedgehog signaling/DD-peptidase zinc-binding domain protein [Vibrio phage 1.089.O._10N.261.51.F9]AUR87301.1 hedgehog signaling/DD-peptidase zinc-binding domain protein [Vibrio phage 1.098.O._10N.286.51.B9]AUS01123.1 hedgehog signaling/DD-peptidase zinc-binding domain protein [Vibrio phage 1.283.A._10N.286.55.A1]AUS01208.1 hedgehog signaling/DD-peptidase zinc-binding domain protein [Vi